MVSNVLKASTCSTARSAARCRSHSPELSSAPILRTTTRSLQRAGRPGIALKATVRCLEFPRRMVAFTILAKL